jgi:Ser/Thr protein kinase RdoA (MazF antagonist)
MDMNPDSDAPLSASSLTAIADAYGLGEALETTYVARGAMGSVNCVGTVLDGARRYWTVKRSFWGQYSEQQITREVGFTRQCESVGVHAPRSIPRIDGQGYVLTVDDQSGIVSQYRVLEWVEGETVDPVGLPIDGWFVQANYDWDDLTDRIAPLAPDVAEYLRVRRADIQDLTDLVHATRETGAIWCHSDISASNLIWGDRGPQLIDWENAGPLVPHQELGCWLRSLGPVGKRAYLTYRQVGGSAIITDVTHIASSVATHLNYVGCQAELLLDDGHIEQHDFARVQVTGAAQSLPTLRDLDQWVKQLQT